MKQGLRGLGSLLAAAFAFAAPAVAGGDPGAIVFSGATIHTAAGDAIERGVLVVKDGKISAIGKAGEVKIPDGAETRDLAGKVVIPGLVDTHSHVGVYSRPAVAANSDGNEMTGPTQSSLRAIDAISPADPGIKMALAGGITTANIMPGSGNVIGGQTAYVKYRGRTIDEMLIKKNGIIGGMKFANGENPKRNYGSRNQAPSTRMGVTAMQRRVFIRAQEYRKQWEDYEKAKAEAKDGKEPKAPERDISLEPMLEILDGRRIVQFHSHRADDLLSAMRLAEEFNFRLVLHHVTEGYMVADEIARRKVPCSIIVVDAPGGKLEAANLSLENGLKLREAGVKVAFHSDDMVINSRFLLRCGALAARAGLSKDEAMKCLTINAAEMLDLQDRVGSLEAGKDADFVILSGDPFSVYTKVLETWIEGEKVFDRSDPKDRLYATGGFAVADRYPAREDAK